VTIQTSQYSFGTHTYSASAFQASVRQGGSGRANDTDDDIFHLKSYHNSTTLDDWIYTLARAEKVVFRLIYVLIWRDVVGNCVRRSLPFRRLRNMYASNDIVTLTDNIIVIKRVIALSPKAGRYRFQHVPCWTFLCTSPSNNTYKIPSSTRGKSAVDQNSVLTNRKEGVNRVYEYRGCSAPGSVEILSQTDRPIIITCIQMKK